MKTVNPVVFELNLRERIRAEDYIFGVDGMSNVIADAPAYEQLGGPAARTVVFMVLGVLYVSND